MIYVAAPWIHKDQARYAVEFFRSAGLSVSSTWVDVPDSNDPGYLEKEAMRDWLEIQDAKVLVLLNLSRSEGKAIEIGMALSLGIPIIGVGKPSAVFHHLTKHFVWVDTLGEALVEVKRVIYKR
jgi:hypothetical protein